METPQACLRYAGTEALGYGKPRSCGVEGCGFIAVRYGTYELNTLPQELPCDTPEETSASTEPIARDPRIIVAAPHSNGTATPLSRSAWEGGVWG